MLGAGKQKEASEMASTGFMLAIILGIIGHASGGPKSSIAKLGWILGLISLVVYIVIALLITAMAFSLVWWIIHFFI